MMNAVKNLKYKNTLEVQLTIVQLELITHSTLSNALS